MNRARMEGIVVFNGKVDFSKKNRPISKALASIPELTFSATLK